MMKKKRSQYIAWALVFLLGSHNGYVALWGPGDTTPRRVFPCKVTSLPPADQAALEAGIPLESGAAISQLLEDYLS